jgi:RimJ/RimL family protein N-acetyltransferase
MAKADLAIGAGGATTWERCCMGLPSIVITVAQNQIPIADALSAQGLIFLIGDCRSVTDDSLSKAIKNNLSEHGLGAGSKNCFDLVDGKGVGRVASIVTLGPKKRLRLRPAKLEDETLLLGWANDSQTRSSSFNTSLICPKSHRNWLYPRLKNISCYRLYIAETQDGLPIGQVRFELGESKDWEIHYSLWVGARGMGFGAKMVSLALEQLRETSPLGKVIGYVKLSNIPSMRIFESLGFLGFQEDTRVVYSLVLNKKRHKAPKIREH